jgi:hypothetical protein
MPKRTITVRRAGSPIIRELIALINESPYSARTVSETAGIYHHAVSLMAKGSNPSLASVEAVLSVLGYQLTIERKTNVRN